MPQYLEFEDEAQALLDEASWLKEIRGLAKK
jgi:hypothetical protein